jgi:hypothetical protein
MKIVATKPRENAIALLIMLFMVSFMLVFVAANANALFNLRREIKLVDQQQKTHWAATNQVPQAKK